MHLSATELVCISCASGNFSRIFVLQDVLIWYMIQMDILIIFVFPILPTKEYEKTFGPKWDCINKIPFHSIY